MSKYLLVEVFKFKILFQNTCCIFYIFELKIQVSNKLEKLNVSLNEQ